MLRSNRGAARVSVVWMISVGVVALVALFFGFVAQSDLSAQETVAEKAVADKAEAEAAFTEANELKRDVSVVLGFYDRASADPQSDIEAAKAKLGELRSTFSDLTDTDADFESVLPKMIAAYDQRGTEIASLQAQIESLNASVQTANAAAGQVQQSKDQVIADLRSQLSDEQQNSTQRQQELEDRLSDANDSLQERDAELRSVRDAMVELRREFEQKERYTSARILALNDGLKFLSEEFASNPDGSIVEVSSVTPVAWIDIGANQRLTRGTRFDVEGGPAGSRKLKGTVEVEEVKPNSALVKIASVTDALDPIVPGDVIINAIYDPSGTRNAVLCGNFSGRYNRTELEALLSNMGVELQDEIGPTTHFLIVGSKLYKDPETGEPLEEPLDPSELPVYKQAEAEQVMIVPLENIRHFFRL